MSQTDLSPCEAAPCLRHPQTETRLRCAECSVPVCPKCMVMYEVGFKCPGCAKKRPSHAQQVSTTRHYAISGLGGLIAGIAYGWLYFWLIAGLGVFRFFGIPVLCWLVSYGLGQAVGRLMQRLLRFKYQSVLTGISLLSIIAGLLLSPFLLALQGAWELVWSAIIAGGGTSVELFLLGSGLNLLSAVFFLRGLIRPLQAP